MKTNSVFAKLITLLLSLIAAMIIFRMLYSGTLRYRFMVWNIFLAWIPYILSTYLPAYAKKEKWKQLFLFASWLLFFPNALYIVTDLVHLRDETNMPWYFDAMLLFSSAFAGLVLAFVSLKNIERFLSAVFTKRTVNLLIPFLLFLGSFGVYLGRFERWNSWNVVDDPLALTKSILQVIVNPLDNIKVWAITVLFTAVYSLIYYSLQILPKAFAENKNAGL